MAKPTVVPTFASSVNYPMDAEPEQGTATKVAPSGAVENYGYRPEAKPKAQNLNYVLYWLSQWAAYVNAGEWDGNLHVTGSLDVDTTLNVDGTTTMVGALTLPTANILLSAGGVTLTAGHVTLTAGKIMHGERRRSFPAPHTGLPFAGLGAGSVGLSGALEPTYTFSLSGGKVVVPMPEFVPGDRIKKIRVTYTSSGGAPTIGLKHYRYAGAPDNISTVVGATTVISGTYSVTEYTISSPTALGHMTGAGALSAAYAYMAALYIESTANTTVIYGFETLYDSVTVPADIS